EISTTGTAAKTTGATVWIYPGMAKTVVGSTLLFIRQHLIGFLDFFKLLFHGFIALRTIRVKLHGDAFISLFDVFIVGAFGDTLYLIVVTLAHSGRSVKVFIPKGWNLTSPNSSARLIIDVFHFFKLSILYIVVAVSLLASLATALLGFGLCCFHQLL